jgi:hypothetical protein
MRTPCTQAYYAPNSPPNWPKRLGTTLVSISIVLSAIALTPPNLRAAGLQSDRETPEEAPAGEAGPKVGSEGGRAPQLHYQPGYERNSGSQWADRIGPASSSAFLPSCPGGEAGGTSRGLAYMG